MTYGTSHYALKTAPPAKGRELLCWARRARGPGGGGAGQTDGRRVIAAASSEEKLEVARAQGADDTLLYDAKPLERPRKKFLRCDSKAKSAPAGVDVVYDPGRGVMLSRRFGRCAWRRAFLL